MRLVRDCLHVEKDSHAVTHAKVDLHKARLAKLEAMRSRREMYMVSDVHADGDNIGLDTTEVEFATEKKIELHVIDECVGNSVAKETGKGEQLTGAITMTAATKEGAANGSERYGETTEPTEVENEIATAIVKDMRNAEHLTVAVSMTRDYKEEVAPARQPPQAVDAKKKDAETDGRTTSMTGIELNVVVSEQVVKAYFMASLSVMESKLLKHIRSKCKKFKKCTEELYAYFRIDNNNSRGIVGGWSSSAAIIREGCYLVYHSTSSLVDERRDKLVQNAVTTTSRHTYSFS
ncbi:hypothetical protein Cgig2_034055 [Carnegiea gigantea]|uniref:Uncharacterized protein n=1 Tax=Carnegiea gigantea TaxID=171969 RepID=A0A9Q1KKW6_9CARY|nr:hypothetical protein Cgig2_034055 [Carnegiea gigantea]